MSSSALTDTRSFIEAQFPVSKVSKESYKERKSNHSQTLTGLGKWWGRKPLVMIRAALIGLLMPPSDDPKRDREIFLKIMTMDDDGLWQRKTKNIKYRDVFELLTEAERAKYFNLDEVEGGKAIHHCIASDSKEEKEQIKETIQRLAFDRLSYDEKLTYCDRPEQIDGPSEDAWAAINDHLNTDASSLPELVQELGERQFGHVPRVGDAFCGGGSVPFEAARLGCEAYGSDLNPVAALLTWASLNIVGGGEAVAQRVRKAQDAVYDAVDEQIRAWGIEHNDCGWRADAYLYCLETTCPECGVDVPLAPSWVIGKRTHTIARLVLDEEAQRFDIHIEQGVSKDDLRAADDAGTVQNDRLQCPACERSTPLRMVRGDRRTDEGTSYGLRMWTNDDLVPRPGDTFQERLYCVRWTFPTLERLVCAEQLLTHDVSFTDDLAEQWDRMPLHQLQNGLDALTAFLQNTNPEAADAVRTARHASWPRAAYQILTAFDAFTTSDASHYTLRRNLGTARNALPDAAADLPDVSGDVPTSLYRSVTDADCQREATVLRLLRERFDTWQDTGYLPSRRIEPGYNTDQPIRERGWTHWHHLFNPRQLLTLGLLNEEANSGRLGKIEKIGCLLGLQRAADHNSRLSGWSSSVGKEIVDHVFANQALNTLKDFGSRSLADLKSAYSLNIKDAPVSGDSTVEPSDAREIGQECELWITDPPYADAINYHELADFFLGWSDGPLRKLLPEWYTDSKRALAITGDEEAFRRDMVESYRNLTNHMPNDGAQIVMFTHQDTRVWADLTLILWAAGLRVTAAWTVATETRSALKKGNYVQGTVLLVLRKRTTESTAFPDDVQMDIEDEVKVQLDAMEALDADEEERSFGETDYQLAAYAAALRVITQHSAIAGWDIERELSRARTASDPSPIETLINDAVEIATNHRIPDGIEPFYWNSLRPVERFYLKGLDLERSGDFRTGSYQALARGFGLDTYTPLLARSTANATRLQNATEFGTALLDASADGFAGSHVRHALYAMHEARAQQDAQAGLQFLREEAPHYEQNRKTLVAILAYLARLRTTLDAWAEDGRYANLVRGAVENDTTTALGLSSL